jgi:hypothetical protein
MASVSSEGEGGVTGEEEPDSGVHASVRNGEGSYRFGKNRGWAAAGFWYWAERVPRGPFTIFLISFLLFYFLISDLFPNLLQIVSIQIKQIPSVFK